jgi:glycosyltransferase involved in cell wall biosynthesis
MRGAPLVSVIIPVFNGGRFIGEAIKSARTQDHRAIEIIVSDDGSTDDSAQAAERSGADLIVSGPNEGPAAARNRALVVAKGSYLAFLDADDVMKPSKISRQLTLLDSRASLGLVLTGFETLVEEGAELPTLIRMQEQQKQGAGFAAMSALVRPEVFDRVGTFDVGYKVGSDTQWLWRVRQAGIEIGTIDEPLFIRRVHGANVTYQDTQVRGGLLRAAREHLNRVRSDERVHDEDSEPQVPG